MKKLINKLLFSTKGRKSLADGKPNAKTKTVEPEDKLSCAQFFDNLRQEKEKKINFIKIIYIHHYIIK